MNSEWGGTTVRRLRKQVIDAYGTVCWLCHQPITGVVSIDHVTPRSQGGTNAIENLRPAHLACNQRRGTRRAPLPLITNTRW